jgi:hypothetical protein
MQRIAFSEEYIKKTLGMVNCPNGECTRVAGETAIKLLGEESCLIEVAKCSNLEEALKKIGVFLTNNSLVIIWVDTGSVTPDNPQYRAIHFYTVYSVKPLKSFSIWEDNGPHFYDIKHTEDRIKEQLRIFGSIEIQHYGIRNKIIRFIIWSIKTLKEK